VDCTEIGVAKALRVHTLAKELGVPSKEIIAKCQAEGIELANHMAAISIGLAESIREWFSVGEDVTSVEVARPVDLTRVRPRPRRKKGAEAPSAPRPETPVAEPALAPSTGAAPEIAVPRREMPAAEELAPAAEAAPEEVAVAVAEPGIAPPAEREEEIGEERGTAPEEMETFEAGVAEAAEPEQVAGEEIEEALRPAASTVVEVEERPPPEPVRPAGPQVVPRPAELRGPRVVRIESPDVVRAPRPRSRPAGVEAPAATGDAEAAARRARGKKTAKEDDRDALHRATRSPRRRGHSSDVGERIREWRDQDLLERKERLASATGQGLRERRVQERRRQATATTVGRQASRRTEVELREPIILKEFCAATGAPFNWVIGKLIEQTGAPRTINQTIEAELAEVLALDLGVTVRVARARSPLEEIELEFQARPRLELVARPPVVTMLGHVDHGKTSLLDAIRTTNVAAGEAGGITQHIGAYRVQRGDWDVTFLDTPGHEAFTSMRARGANLTDVVVLVVAADDGVMPQTIEAINHAKAASVPIVVALNKIDLPNVDLNKIYGQLAEQGLTPTEWGGETDVIHTSATTGQGIDDLVAHLSTLSELLDLKADATVPACAVVVEAQMREGQGVVAQVLVREGTLRAGQVIVCGPAAGRVRALRDHAGRAVEEAPPGTPVEVSGLDELPETGDRMYQLSDLSRAKSVAEDVGQSRRQASLQATTKARTLEQLLATGEQQEVPELRVIVKADVQGSVDVLRNALAEFPAEKARLHILHSGVGAISEADVALARASEAIIIGFYVVAEDRARQLAEQSGVEIRVYRVIYEILGDLHKALQGLLAPLKHEETRATLEVRQVFKITRFGAVAGCIVTDGVANRSHRVRLVRDGRIVVEGNAIGSLRRFKDDVREVRAGFECGLKIESFDDVKPGDIVHLYEIVEVAQEL